MFSSNALNFQAYTLCLPSELLSDCSSWAFRGCFLVLPLSQASPICPLLSSPEILVTSFICYHLASGDVYFPSPRCLLEGWGAFESILILWYVTGSLSFVILKMFYIFSVIRPFLFQSLYMLFFLYPLTWVLTTLLVFMMYWLWGQFLKNEFEYIF